MCNTRSENAVTLADPGLDSQAPKHIFSSVAVSLSSRVSSKVKAKFGPTNILILEFSYRFLPIIKSILCLSAPSDGETTRPQLTLEPSQPEPTS